MLRCQLIAIVLATGTVCQAADLPGDPTRPLDSVRVEKVIEERQLTEEFVLTYLRAGQSPVAVVNGQRVSEGDPLGSAKILRITRRGVRVRTGSGQLRWVEPGVSGFSKTRLSK